MRKKEELLLFVGWIFPAAFALVCELLEKAKFADLNEGVLM